MYKESELQSVTKEELIKELIKAADSKKYGLVWEDKKEEFEEHTLNKLPVLKVVSEMEIVTDTGKPHHLLIEGDNFHSLMCLSYTHREKVDIIYIDPPYNTGSNDFKYNDNYIDKSDRYRHSKWLSFMHKRLQLARDLLKNTGVIFISINEEEVFQLKILCDQIFGHDNYLTMFTVRVRHEDRILKGDKDFHEVVEYLLMYRKTPAHKTSKREKDNTSIDEYVYEVVELNPNPEKMVCGKKEVSVFKPGEYEIIRHEANADLLKKINIRGTLKEGTESGRFYMRHFDGLEGMFGYLFKVPNMGKDKYGYRYFLRPESDRKANGHYFQGVPTDRKDILEVPYPNFLDYEQNFNNVGYEGNVNFRNGKKPLEFLLKVFEIGGIKKDSVVLDFFAGSASTGHAVLELNKRDGGQRQFIVCTNNENNICRDITYPRLKNAIEGYEFEGNETQVLYEEKLTWSSFANAEEHIQKIAEIEEENKDKFDKVRKEIKNDTLKVIGQRKITGRKEGLGGSLKYVVIGFVGEHPVKGVTDRDKLCLAENAGDMAAVRENTLIKLEENQWYCIYTDNSRYTAVYFREEVDMLPELKDKLMAFEKPAAIYIFSWGKNEYASDFDDMENVRVEDIPEPIVKVYRRMAGGV